MDYREMHFLTIARILRVSKIRVMPSLRTIIQASEIIWWSFQPGISASSAEGAVKTLAPLVWGSKGHRMLINSNLVSTI